MVEVTIEEIKRSDGDRALALVLVLRGTAQILGRSEIRLRYFGPQKRSWSWSSWGPWHRDNE